MTAFTINAVATAWTATIEILDPDKNVISGPHAYSGAVSDVQINFGEIRTRNNPNTFVPWTASISLEPGISPFSLDNRDTLASPTGASLLAKGNRVNILQDGQRFWPPLYILRTPSPLNLQQDAVELDLGDISQLNSLLTPEGDFSNIEIGTPTAPHVIINRIATAIGIPTSSDTILTGWNISVPVPKTDTNSYINQIGEIAAANGHIAWIDQNEQLRFTPIDFDQSAPVVSLVIGRDEVGVNPWQPRNFDERAPGKLTVVGGGGRADEIDNPQVNPILIQDGMLIILTGTETIDVTPLGTSPNTTTTYREQQAENRILPQIAITRAATVDDPPTRFGNVFVSFSVNPSTALRDSQDYTEIHEYSRLTGALLRTTITNRLPRALAGGDAYSEVEGESLAYDLIDAETTTITYEYNRITGLLERRTEVVRRPLALFGLNPSDDGAFNSSYELNRFLTRDYLRRTTEWENVTSLFSSTERWRQKQETLRPQGVLYADYRGTNPDRLVVDSDPDPERSETFDRTRSDGSTRPPQTQYQQSLYEVDDTLFSGSVNITPLAGDAFKQPDKVLEFSVPAIVSSGQCSSLAETYGFWQHGLSLGYSFVGAIPLELYTNFFPGMRVDVTDQGVTRAYFVNGLTVGGDDQETLFSCNLGLIGDVGVTPDIVVNPISIAINLFNDEDLPDIQDNPVVTVGVLGTENTETLPAIEDNPSVVVGSENVTNDEELPRIQDNPLATPVGPVFVVNSEDLPSIQDNPVVSVDVTNNEILPAIEDNPFAAEPAGQDPDAANYIARLNGTYSQPELDAINAFFVALKDANIYAKFDFMYFFAMDTEADALLNLVSTSFTGVNNNMTFTARQGMRGNGINSFIGTGYNPSTAGGNWVLDRGSIATYIRDNSTSRQITIGARSLSPDTISFVQPNTGGGEFLGIFNARQSSIRASVSDIRGLQVTSRTSANLTTTYSRATALGTSSEAPDGLINNEVYVAGHNNAGSLVSSDVGIVFADAGGDLNQTEVTALDTAVQDLAIAFGAQF